MPEIPSFAPPVHTLYEDEALIAVQKPAPLQCHPSPSAPRGSDTLEGRVQVHLGAPAHPVHRLDAETTGVVLFAKLPFAQAHIQRQMQEGTFRKTYFALVCGSPEPRCGVIDAPIARIEPDSFTRAVLPDGQHAVSRMPWKRCFRNFRWFGFRRSPDEPISCACIWRMSATRCWAIRGISLKNPPHSLSRFMCPIISSAQFACRSCIP